jgi:Protein ENHANCED DISEASE RESISTANCE 2, C-terminal
LLWRVLFGVVQSVWFSNHVVSLQPAIIGRKLPVSYQYYEPSSSSLAPLLECTLDIGSSSITAKRIVNVCRRYMSALTVDIGFVIEGQHTEELPEQMMGALRIHGPDPLRAPAL